MVGFSSHRLSGWLNMRDSALEFCPSINSSYMLSAIRSSSLSGASSASSLDAISPILRSSSTGSCLDASDTGKNTIAYIRNHV